MVEMELVEPEQVEAGLLEQTRRINPEDRLSPPRLTSPSSKGTARTADVPSKAAKPIRDRRLGSSFGFIDS